MGKGDIHDKAEKLLSKIAAAATGIKEAKNTSERIHSLRLAYKRLRALLRATGIEDALPATLKDLYHKAGEVRDLQLYIEQLKTINELKANAPIEYIAALSVENNGLSSELLKAIDNLDYENLKELLQQRIPDSIKKKNIQSFADIKETAARTLHPIAKKDEEIHQIRKYLKDSVYALELVDKKPRKKLNKVIDLLGEINDINRFLFLSESMPDNLPEMEQKIVKRMRKNWIDRKHGLKEKLLKAKI